MASFLNILLTITIATSIVQIFVVGQTNEEITKEQLKESETSYFRELLQDLLSHWSHLKPKTYSSSEDLEAESSDYVSDENRPSRNLHMGESHLCEMVRRLVELPTDEYEYRPSFYYEMSCTQHTSLRPFHGNTPQIEKKKYCYNNKCEDEIQEITIFRRRRNGASCWEPHSRKIPVGCTCKFPVQHLPILTYTP